MFCSTIFVYWFVTQCLIQIFINVSQLLPELRFFVFKKTLGLTHSQNSHTLINYIILEIKHSFPHPCNHLNPCRLRTRKTLTPTHNYLFWKMLNGLAFTTLIYEHTRTRAVICIGHRELYRAACQRLNCLSSRHIIVKVDVLACSRQMLGRTIQQLANHYTHRMPERVRVFRFRTCPTARTHTRTHLSIR